MDLIKIALAKISRGHATSYCGIVVMRVGDKFTFGETINIRSRGENIDDAAKGIYNMMRQR